MRFPVLTLCATAATFVLSGCSSLQRSDSFFGFITPYRIEIVQGNAVTKEQLAQVKTGMTRSQVRDVLGSPLVTDPFHANRWDYVFTIRRPGTEPQHRSVVVNFEGEGVKSIEAPELPSEQEFVASISRFTKVPEARKLELTEEERKALPVPPKRVEPPQAADEGAVRTYPPLEAS